MPQQDAPVFVIHALAHAVAALQEAAAAGCGVVLLSAPEAGIYAGPGWFKAVIAAARDTAPAAQSVALIDCGDDAGAAQAAIRAGVEGIVFRGSPDAAARLAAVAAERGIRFATVRPAALDLGTAFFAGPEALRRSCADRLASPIRFC